MGGSRPGLCTHPEAGLTRGQEWREAVESWPQSVPCQVLQQVVTSRQRSGSSHGLTPDMRGNSSGEAHTQRVKLFTASLISVGDQSSLYMAWQIIVTGGDSLDRTLEVCALYVLEGEHLSKVQITFLNPHHSPGKQVLLSPPHHVSGLQRCVSSHRLGICASLIEPPLCFSRQPRKGWSSLGIWTRFSWSVTLTSAMNQDTRMFQRLRRNGTPRKLCQVRQSVFGSQTPNYVDSHTSFSDMHKLGEYVECRGTKRICMCSTYCIIDSIIHVGIIHF